MDKNVSNLCAMELSVCTNDVIIGENIIDSIEVKRKENERGKIRGNCNINDFIVENAPEYVNCIVPYKTKIYMSQVKIEKAENGIIYAKYHNIDGTVELIKNGNHSFLVFNPIKEYNTENAYKQYTDDVIEILQNNYGFEKEKATNLAKKYYRNIEKRYVFGKSPYESADVIFDLFVDNRTGYRENMYLFDDNSIAKDFSAYDSLNVEEQYFENTIAKRPGKWGITSKSHGVVFESQFLYKPEYAYFDTFVVYKGDMWEKDGDVYKSDNQKCGVVDVKGKEIIPFEYDQIKAVWKIGSDEAEMKYIACKNNKWGVVNKDNEIVVPFEFDAIAEDTFVASYSLFCMKEGKTEYLTLQNDNIVYLNLESIAFKAS